MIKSDITPVFEHTAFHFFYAFARFEFCLKEAGYLKSDKPGKKAEPNWDRFVRSNRSRYTLSAAALALLNAAPQQQISTAPGKLAWREIEFDENEYELQAVAILLRTARNNVFHGGRHGANGWDDVNRTMQILTHGKTVLDELAEFARFGDYLRR
ncbi:hypothetical protein [Stenotrophomonas sp. YIM B06876]|uniref:hypothetical protein n=1 Tax=Stenotrophomonas sp. YIM B06876 TaxID=3060211 RepID=UPI00273842D8|nr:hypothetical protein [Stenotrophomonas sp. YIM B06876]